MNKNMAILLAKHRRRSIESKSNSLLKSGHTETNSITRHAVGNKGIGVRLKTTDVYGNGKPLHETLQEQKGQKTKLLGYKGKPCKPSIELHKSIVDDIGQDYSNNNNFDVDRKTYIKVYVDKGKK